MEAAGGTDFGALLRQFRLDAGLTQQELAERAKLSVEAISTLERGARTRPQRETVALLGRALNLAPEREALLGRAVGVPHSPRRRGRSEALKASLLQIVRPDTQATPTHNLPQQLTSFVGRQREVGEIAALLGEHRLVTVVGAGGVGKTRIAVQTGSGLLGCPDGVWLVDLAPLADQTLLASAVLSALQHPSTTGSALEAVVAFLKTRRLLLILDNCEHVIAGARDVAATIVQLCPSVRLLSTSRQALEIPGERVYRLPSLAVPPDACRTARDASSYGAVALFVDRALAVDADFALTDDNARDVAEICRRLDGIPLAIELAAARVKVLAPRQITQWLHQRFRLLTRGDPRALPRHQTMTALIDWSYDLLTPREQRFFESLSIFAGGCTLEAATAVCATDQEDDLDVIELVASLVTKSLLLAELAGSEQRYRLLESSRQHAREKVAARGEQEGLARRHALFYLDLAERLERAWEVTPELAWLEQAKVELENCRAVLEWAVGKQRDVILGQRLAALRRVVWRSFPLPEARRWVQAALELVDERTPLHLVARLQHADAEGASHFAETKVSLAAAERALVRYREVGDALGIAQAQNLAAASLVILERFAEAEPLLQDALAAARDFGDRRLVATVLRTMGIARTRLGDFAGARAYFTEALGLAKVAGAEFLAASVAAVLADNEGEAGDAETALRLMTDVLATYRALNYSAAPRITLTVADIAAYLIVLSRYDEARVQANEALDLARRLGMAVVVALSLLYLVIAALLRPNIEGRRTPAEYGGAARLLGFVATRLTKLGVPEASRLPKEYDRALGVLRAAIGAHDVEQLMAVGATMTEDEAIEQARALE